MEKELMGLKRQLERLQKWACDTIYDCHDCKYARHGDWNESDADYGDWCPFEVVSGAIEDRAKEKDNDT